MGPGRSSSSDTPLLLPEAFTAPLFVVGAVRRVLGSSPDRGRGPGGSRGQDDPVRMEVARPWAEPIPVCLAAPSSHLCRWPCAQGRGAESPACGMQREPRMGVMGSGRIPSPHHAPPCLQLLRGEQACQAWRWAGDRVPLGLREWHRAETALALTPRSRQGGPVGLESQTPHAGWGWIPLGLGPDRMNYLGLSDLPPRQLGPTPPGGPPPLAWERASPPAGHAGHLSCPLWWGQLGEASTCERGPACASQPSASSVPASLATAGLGSREGAGG